MSAISLKSITGITSITTPAGVDNVFTVHTNDTTERFRVDSTGNLNIAGIITASQGLKINVSPAITIRDGTTEKGYIGFNGNDPFIGRKNGVGVAFQNNKIRPVDGDDGSGSNNTVDLGEPTYRFKDGYFAGSLDIEGDIDVNGHTNLDNVSIAGITTISSSGDALTIGAATNASRNLIISADRPANADLGNIIAKNTGGNIAAITFNTGTRSQKDDGVIDFKISPHSGQQLTRAMRLTNGFNLIFGITEAHTSVLGAYSPKIQLESTTVAASSIFLNRDGNDGGGSHLFLGHGRSGNGAVQDGDNIGNLMFVGGTGSNFRAAANISCSIDVPSGGSISNTSMPGTLILSTSNNNQSSPVEAMRIRPDGRIVMGGSSAVSFTPHANADELVIGATSAANRGITILGGNGNRASIYFGDTDDNDVGQIDYNHGDNSMMFHTNADERLRIYSGGQVSIRNTNATSFNGGGDDLVIGNATDGQDAGITLYSHSSDNGSIFFNDTADTGLTGLIQYRHSEDAMRFVVATQERLRIDSAGVARFINPTGQLTLASSTNNDSGKILFQENTTGAWSLEAQRANGYFRISDEYNGNSGSAAERLRIEPADNGNTTITDNNLVIKKTSIAGNGVGGITIGKDVSGVDGCIQINSVKTGADTDQIGIDFKTHKSTAGSAAPQETLRITHRGRLLYREYPYTDSYQASNWGGAYYLKGGWMRFTSNFSNPTKDLVILPDGGNTNSGMFIKVTVMQLDYPGGDRGVGAIHIGYASAKRKGDASGKWHAECSSSMNMESGSNFHGNFSSMGSLSWENSNPSDTNTLRYTANRVTNYDTYDVQVEVWQAGNCAYYLHSDFLTQ